MSETKKLTQEEMNQIQNLQEKYSDIAFKLGQLKVEQLLLNRQVERLSQLETELSDAYFSVQKEEAAIADEISKKYGNVEINIESGEITPSV